MYSCYSCQRLNLGSLVSQASALPREPELLKIFPWKLILDKNIMSSSCQLLLHTRYFENNNLTEHFTILEQNKDPAINGFYAVRKGRCPNFEALKLWNIRSGNSWELHKLRFLFYEVYLRIGFAQVSQEDWLTDWLTVCLSDWLANLGQAITFTGWRNLVSFNTCHVMPGESTRNCPHTHTHTSMQGRENLAGYTTYKHYEEEVMAEIELHATI